MKSERLKVKGMFLLIFLSIFNFQFSICRAQLLYEISGNGARSKSYVLATNRYVEMQFLDTIPNVFKCFGKCDKVLTEFAMQDYEALAALRQAALLPDSIILRNFYGEKEYEFIDNSLRINIGMNLEQLCRMKPSYLTELYRAELMKEWLRYDEQKSMESFFENVAAERNMPVIGLDNIGETMYMLFDREPFHWQCKELIKVMEYPENEVKQERTLRQMYLDGRLSDMAYQVEGPDNKTSLSFSDYKVWCQRNKEWVKRLKPYLTEGKCFITLNAVYLGGDKGLLEQLRAAGYRVRPVNRGIKNNKTDVYEKGI
ncbi:MAG: TraB/GumN family protein [Paludibacteraceae bacterium]|nr:TraB/GumN family protein [Paludibacteraceae bacterium]MBQ6984966.1 TraB/GumN family protein [Paludibacteraceae bacterium]